MGIEFVERFDSLHPQNDKQAAKALGDAGLKPLVLGANGEKLSKQNGAQAIDPTQPMLALNQAAATLGLPAQSGSVEQALTVWTAAWASAWIGPGVQVHAT